MKIQKKRIDLNGKRFEYFNDGAGTTALVALGDLAGFLNSKNLKTLKIQIQELLDFKDSRVSFWEGKAMQFEQRNSFLQKQLKEARAMARASLVITILMGALWIL